MFGQCRPLWNTVRAGWGVTVEIFIFSWVPDERPTTGDYGGMIRVPFGSLGLASD